MYLSPYKADNDQYKYLLNIIDVYSKYLVTYPLLNKKGITVCKKMEEYCYMLGYPAIIQIDNGLEFKNVLFYKFAKDNKITLKNSRPRNSKCNTQIERYNQVLIILLIII